MVQEQQEHGDAGSSGQNDQMTNQERGSGGRQENGQREKPSGKRSRRKIAAVVLALLIIIAAILTYYFWHRSQIYVSTDDAFVEGHIYTISARISGAISGVYVVDNQWVEQNELLVKLDPATYEVAVRNDEAALDLARNQVAQMQADVQVAEAQLRNAEANLQLADEELKRAQELVKSGIQSQQQLDRARATERVARGGVQAAYEQLRKAKAALGTIPESGVHPLIAQRRAELEQAKLDLIYTNIYAPVHGHVTQKSAEVGERIQSGQPLMSIVPLNDIWIVANYKETQLKRVRVGQPVEIRVDAYPEIKLEGAVQSIMAGSGAVFSLFPPENATGNYVKVVQRIPVKIVLDERSDSQVLRVGMSVVPTIDTTAAR